MDFNINNRDFCNAIKTSKLMVFPPCVFAGKSLTVSTVDHAMVCKRGGFVIQRHNELRDLEAKLLRTVCGDDEIEHVLQEISRERLNRGTNKAPDARLGTPTIGILRCQA